MSAPPRLAAPSIMSPTTSPAREIMAGKPAAILQAPLLKEIFQVRATELFDPADGARILRFGALAQGGISEKPVH